MPETVDRRQELRALLAARAPVHMLGVCGVGMAGLARLLALRGIPVSGCDAAATGGTAAWLKACRIPVYEGHSATHLDPAIRWVVRSTAVAPDHAEPAAARARALPVFQRGEVLPALLEHRLSVAVCGSHGKSTTTTLLAWILRASGQAPAWCIGAEAPGLPGLSGDDGGALVVEADESDGTLTGYAPDYTILTNVDFDHMEHFANVDAFENCFRQIIRQTRRALVVCADDARAAALSEAADVRITYGFHAAADVRIENLEETAAGAAFTLRRAPGEPVPLRIPAPGRHNVQNAAAAAIVALELGVSQTAVRQALAAAQLPRRRFECVAAAGNLRVISDYAHHPTEIAALVAMSRNLGARRLRAVFQPHRYTRTRALGAAFPAAFAGVDEVVLLPVYAASEPPLAGGRIWDLYAAFRAVDGPVTRLAADRGQAWRYLAHTLRAGDVLLVVGAGDVVSIAEAARRAAAGNELPARQPDLSDCALGPTSRWTADYPLGRRTTFGLGGTADVWVVVGCEADLAALQAWCRKRATPLHVHAAGSNVLVSDLGVRGVVATLSPTAFGAIARRGEEVVVGAACPLARLLDWCMAQGRAGLELLEGIPGTVGGALRMNAGAWGMTFGAHVSWIRGLNSTGNSAIVSHDHLGLAYRRCLAAEEHVVLEVALRLPSGDPAAIRAVRRATAERRAWMRGLRSAGSVFRNPEGGFAGALIEQAGLKERRIGGAYVTTQHANVIAAESGATASDVLALMWQVQDAVRCGCGVALQREVIVLE